MRQHLSFREHFRRGNADWATDSALTPINLVLNLWAHGNPVIYSSDSAASQAARSASSRSAQDRTHAALQDDLSAVRLDRDPVGVDQRAESECLLDLLLTARRDGGRPSAKGRFSLHSV